MDIIIKIINKCLRGDFSSNRSDDGSHKIKGIRGNSDAGIKWRTISWWIDIILIKASKLILRHFLRRIN